MANTKLVLNNETYTIIGICMEIHRELGHGFLEIVYKDAIEYELRTKVIQYEREKEFEVQYKNLILPHKFYADFVVFNNIILEVKALEAGFADIHYSMLINYLKVSGCKVGLLVNFARKSLEYKRVIF